MEITNNANFDYSFRNLDYNKNASVIINKNELPEITITKEANPSVVYTGDKVTYFVKISISDFEGNITNQIFSDILPDTLEFIEDSLTLDAEKITGDIANLPVDFKPNTEHLIIYQCKVL